MYFYIAFFIAQPLDIKSTYAYLWTDNEEIRWGGVQRFR